MSSYPNPYKISDIPSGWTVKFFGDSNSGFPQFVSIYKNPGPNEVKLTEFAGQGEGVALTLENGKEVFKWTSDGSDLSLIFSASKDQGRTSELATIARFTEGNGSTVKFYEFGTEDFEDGDNNDTVFTVFASKKDA